MQRPAVHVGPGPKAVAASGRGSGAAGGLGRRHPHRGIAMPPPPLLMYIASGGLRQGPPHGGHLSIDAGHRAATPCGRAQASAAMSGDDRDDTAFDSPAPGRQSRPRLIADDEHFAAILRPARLHRGPTLRLDEARRLPGGHGQAPWTETWRSTASRRGCGCWSASASTSALDGWSAPRIGGVPGSGWAPRRSREHAPRRLAFTGGRAVLRRHTRATDGTGEPQQLSLDAWTDHRLLGRGI